TAIPISTPAQTHYATNTIVVSNLTRNAIVRSSGTVTTAAGGNTAYIDNFVTSATSFMLTNGEFDYLGKSGCSIVKDCGITFDGNTVTGKISSSTINNPGRGVNLAPGLNVTIDFNSVTNSGDYGIGSVLGTGGGHVINANAVGGSG